MFNSPAGGSGELFPSPAKGHTDQGLSGEQSSDAQTLIDSALSGYYPRGTVDNLLAGKQPTIAEGSLAQSKIKNLTGDLAAKASTQQLADGLAAKHPLITATATLPQNLVTDFTSALAARQPLLNDSSHLVVDTVSSRLYLGDVFRFWKADQSSSLLTMADNALGAEFAMTVRAPNLTVANSLGVGTSTPQAALDVVGSILGSAGLRIGSIDVIERLLEHTASCKQLPVG